MELSARRDAAEATTCAHCLPDLDPGEQESERHKSKMRATLRDVFRSEGNMKTTRCLRWRAEGEEAVLH